MPTFIVKITADGYDTAEEESAACVKILEEWLDSAAVTCKVIKEIKDEE